LTPSERRRELEAFITSQLAAEMQDEMYSNDSGINSACKVTASVVATTDDILGIRGVPQKVLLAKDPLYRQVMQILKLQPPKLQF
jgi:hypothetical protein